MRLEYLEDPEAREPRVLLLYGDDPQGAAILRRAVEELASGSNREVRVDRLGGFQAVDGCSLAASVGMVDSGVEPLDGSGRAFRCVLRPESWTRVADLLEPFEKTPPRIDAARSRGVTVGARFQYLTETGPVEWIISTERGW